MFSKYYNYGFLDLRKLGKYDYNIEVCFLYKPFYIGKGKYDRNIHHKYDKSSYYKAKLVRKLLLEYDITDISVIFVYDLDEETAYKKEIYYIKSIGKYSNGGPLTNHTDGGEGRSSKETEDEEPRTTTRNILL